MDSSIQHNSDSPIVIRIGVTGHRTLADEQRIRASIRRALSMIDAHVRHVPHRLVAVTPLAEGADRLVAQELLAWPVSAAEQAPSLEVILPLPVAAYLQDFETEQSKQEFLALLDLDPAPKVLAGMTRRSEAYAQVGRAVVDACRVLIAVWDGQLATGQGGTADTVAYARRRGRTCLLIDPASGLLTEERGTDGTFEALDDLDARYCTGVGHNKSLEGP
jgi:hypothetical protein